MVDVKIGICIVLVHIDFKMCDLYDSQSSGAVKSLRKNYLVFNPRRQHHVVGRQNL